MHYSKILHAFNLSQNKNLYTTVNFSKEDSQLFHDNDLLIYDKNSNETQVNKNNYRVDLTLEITYDYLHVEQGKIGSLNYYISLLLNDFFK